MLECYKCGNKILKESDFYICAECGSNYPIIENVPRFNEIINSNEYNYEEYATEINKIAKAENIHFWFKSRNKFIAHLFNKFISRNDKILEVGAGTGSISAVLKKEGYDMSIGEIHPCGIEYARSKTKKMSIPIYQFDITKSPFRNEFDVVCLFDVLEHIKDDTKVVQNIYKILKKKGKIVLTVPAHMWLWCEDDEISNHFRRYEIKNLKEMLNKEGFSIKYATNFFIAIIPLLYIRTKIKASKEISINPLVNLILLIVSNIENKILNYISSKIGGSIIIIAEKK